MPLAVGPEEGHQEEKDEREERQSDDDDGLGRRRDEGEDREVAEEVPVRPWIGDNVGGIRRLAELWCAKDRREHHDDDHRGGGDGRVPPRRVGPERDAAPQDLGIAAAVCPALDHLARDGRLADPPLHDEIQVQADEAEHRGRDEEHMRRVEARECRAADVLPRDDELRENVADQRCARGLLGGDDDGPEGVLVPAQELAGEGHREREEQQQRS